MVKQYKVDRVQELTRKLQEKKNIILTDYSGTKVSHLTALRNKLRAKDIDYKVVKNNLFKRALKETGYPEVDAFLKGPIGVAFVKEDLGEAAKIFKDFKKEQEKFNFSLGIMDNIVYNEEQIKRIADIPSKEVLISQIMSLINSAASNMAMVINQTIASVPRGIKAVAEKNAN
ncbi:MAG: 50S ribosomal protein L10 [Spirochaetes bacterium]|nr:50S ribosomal protein L10 [Spirochaetota bacterium]